MGRVLFLGHGGFDPTSGSDVAEVLIPPNTSIKFYSDAGQALSLPANNGDSDYLKVVKVWEHFKEAEKPIGPRGVTYNFRLSPEDNESERTLAKSLDWGSDTEIVTLPAGSDKFYLCTGTAATCPTPKLNVANERHGELVALGDEAVTAYKQWFKDGANVDALPEAIKSFRPRLTDVLPAHLEYVGEGVPESRWYHDCKGILSEHADSELFWVACTSFVVKSPDLNPLDQSSSPGPAAASNNWEPSAGLDGVRAKNKANIEATPKDGTINVVAGGTVVLVGPGHAAGPAEYVRRQAENEAGQIIVTKGFLGKPGNLAVMTGGTGGISSMKDLVKSELELSCPGFKVTFPLDD